MDPEYTTQSAADTSRAWMQLFLLCLTPHWLWIGSLYAAESLGVYGRGETRVLSPGLHHKYDYLNGKVCFWCSYRRDG
jgi:hypothetical protein